MLRRQLPSIDQVLTFGVEEEFLLVDADSRRTVPRCPDVLPEASDRLPGRIQHEYYATQIEANSRPAATAEALRHDLATARGVLAMAAARAGCLLVAGGSAVLTGSPLPVTADPRFALMTARYASCVANIDSESSGYHVHLGELTRDEAVGLGNHMRPWLPILQALAANSPFAAGRQRECASWRHFQQLCWPTMGPTPMLGPGDYEVLAHELVTSGVLLDRKMIYWYARPSEHLPTLEIRVTDVNSDIDVEVLLAVLIRGLGTALLAEMRQGRPWPPVADAELREAHRQAARHGLGGRWVETDSGAPMTLSAGLGRLVQRAMPALEAAGEARLALDLLQATAMRGTGDQRQRADYRMRGSFHDVVDRLAARTLGV